MTSSIPPPPIRLHPTAQRSDPQDPALGRAGLLVTSRLRFITRRTQDRRTSPYWEPVSAGLGAYAEVFRVEECVHYDSAVLTQTPLARRLVAKVFRDTAPGDFESVYASEVQTLLNLGQHERIVMLRGAADSVAPTFVCGHIDCGEAFYVETCAQCGQPLRNGDANDTVLICSKGHRYQKYNPEHVRILTQKRPCQHLDECKAINFLFRPYILLEELDLDLRQLNERLTSPAGKNIDSADALTFDSKADTDERRREVLLLRLDTLIGVAEGIAFLHSRGCLHTDIAPENAMVRCVKPLGDRDSALGSLTAKVIDFGLAKRVEDNRTTTTVVGRMTFLAPEQMVTQGALGPRVRIRFRNAVPREGEICQISTLNGAELPFERRDYVWDVEDGQYEVLAESEVSSESSAAFEGSPVDSKGAAARSTFARVLKPPQSGQDASQTTLRFSYALDLPTDIFSLGCLLAWSITGGQEELVMLLRELSSVASRQRLVLPAERCCELLSADLKKILGAIDIPNTASDDAVKGALIDVVCRCLVRSEGAYCRRRSSGYNQPAVEVVKDLRHIRNSLFLMAYAESDVSRHRQQQASEQAARNAADKAQAAQLMRDLERKNDEARANARKLGWWRAAAAGCLGMVAVACGAMWWSPRLIADAPKAEPPEAAQVPAQVPPQAPPPTEAPAVIPLSIPFPPPEVRTREETPTPVVIPEPAPAATPAPQESSVPKSEPMRTAEPARPKASPRKVVLPDFGDTIASLARALQRLFPEICAPTSDSSVKTGDAEFEFEVDSETGIVYGVKLLNTSPGLKLNNHCSDQLKSQRTNFKSASDFKTKFTIQFHL